MNGYPEKPPHCTLPWCGKTGRIDWHHIQRRSQGGTNDPDNLAGICHECHMAHHDGRATLEFTKPPLGMRPLVRCVQLGHEWASLHEYNEFDQSVPFDEPTADDGDAIHDALSRLTQAAQTASTLDYVVGSILEELAALVTTQELYDAVEEAFGIARSTTPSFISRRRKYAKLDERFADLGLSRGLSLIDASEKADRPIEYLEADIRALTNGDFRVKWGLKKESAEKHACPECGAVHVCKCTASGQDVLGRREEEK